MTHVGDGGTARNGMRIDLNADLGEGIGDDEALLAIVTSANIATGAHAGGGAVLTRAVAAAARRGVAIGAHPSYRDRAGFGRASHLTVLHHDVSARSHLVGDLVEQILVVAREAERHGSRWPTSRRTARSTTRLSMIRWPRRSWPTRSSAPSTALGYRVAVVTQPGGELAALASGRGLTVLFEGFADRAYVSTGQLVGRSEPGAVLGDIESMVAQALGLAAGHVTPIDGPRIAVAVDSLCVHGDTPGAVAAARAIRAALEQQGWLVGSPSGQVAAREHAAGDGRIARGCRGSGSAKERTHACGREATWVGSSVICWRSPRSGTEHCWSSRLTADRRAPSGCCASRRGRAGGGPGRR